MSRAATAAETRWRCGQGQVANPGGEGRLLRVVGWHFQPAMLLRLLAAASLSVGATAGRGVLVGSGQPSALFSPFYRPNSLRAALGQ